MVSERKSFILLWFAAAGRHQHPSSDLGYPHPRRSFHGSSWSRRDYLARRFDSHTASPVPASSPSPPFPLPAPAHTTLDRRGIRRFGDTLGYCFRSVARVKTAMASTRRFFSLGNTECVASQESWVHIDTRQRMKRFRGKSLLHCRRSLEPS